MTTKPKKRAVAYLRVSTDKQVEEGVSLDEQRAKVKAYAALYDIELVDIKYDAGLSGRTLDRPGLQQALGMLRSREADALLVVKLDRLTRSVRDLGALLDTWFQKGKFTLLSVSENLDTSSAAGRMVMNMMGVINQWLREDIAERTSAAMRHKRSVGEFTGGAAPYGYTSDDAGRLVPVDTEQEAVLMARSLRDAFFPLREISTKLAEAGHYSRSGRKFAAIQVARMVNSTGAQ